MMWLLRGTDVPKLAQREVKVANEVSCVKECISSVLPAQIRGASKIYKRVVIVKSFLYAHKKNLEYLQQKKPSTLIMARVKC